MTNRTTSSVSRRQFLASTAAGTVATLAGPAILTAKKSDSQIIVGTGDYKFEIVHDWPEMPSQFSWQTTHNVAVDKAG